HIQEVLVLPGAPSAVRYEAVQPVPVEGVYSNEAPWLVVYEMPDIEYRSSDAFLNLSVRNPPPKELIDEIYMNTRFDVRFYEEKQKKRGGNTHIKTSAPATFVISSALHPASDADSLTSFDSWYREEYLPALSRIPGFVRSR
ncbi:uncharacterized protein SETTUDRAFT_61372, partial [Exserohilum turcica Et28A]